MKNKLLLTTSALILMGTTSAMADNNNDKPYVETTTQAEIEANWEATKKGVSNAWQDTKNTVSNITEDASEATAEAYNETRALLDTNTDIDVYVENGTHVTAETVIGQDIFDPQGDVIATVSDFILDENGQVRNLVVSYGGFMGVGSKDIVLDFDTFEARSNNSGYDTKLTKINFNNYPEFNAKKLSQSMHLASDLMNASVVNPSMDELAEVDNIIIKNGNATKLIVSYVDGVMPEKAMIDFTDADIVFDAYSDAHFKLSMNESKQFNNFINQ